MTNTTCAHCGKMFPATRSTATFCSVRCRVAFHRIADPEGKEQRGYYCYTHATPDGEVFYVGKGRKGRAWDFESRNDDHKAIVRKHGWENIRVEIFPATTEEEALHLERFLINVCFGRDGLANKSPGGEGAGYALSNAEKQAAYRARQGNKLEQAMKENDTLRARIVELELELKAAHARIGELEQKTPKPEQPKAEAPPPKPEQSKQPKPAPGEYFRFVQRLTPLRFELERIRIEGGKCFRTLDNGLVTQARLTFSRSRNCWLVEKEPLFESVESALHALPETDRIKALPFKDTPDEELRKLWSYHHPDRKKEDGDQIIFQLAGDELKGRRKSV